MRICEAAVANAAAAAKAAEEEGNEDSDTDSDELTDDAPVIAPGGGARQTMHAKTPLYWAPEPPIMGT